MSTGYSGTPLVRKLGIKPGMRILPINAPREYTALVEGIPERVEFASGRATHLDLVHLFVTSKLGLGVKLRQLRARIRPTGMIWVSWPKKSSGVRADISEDLIRSAALEAELVDVKVCAVDSIWSGLKLVIRTTDRTREA